MHGNGSKTTKYIIGVVGDTASLLGFWEILSERLGSQALSETHFAAMALPEAKTPPERIDLGIGIPAYVGFREMLYLHPEINLVIETTGDPALLTKLRKTLPGSVTLVERAAASFFINLLTSDQKCMACKINDKQTQTMLNTVVDQLGADIFFLDGEGRVMNVNQTFCDASGMHKREAIGRNIEELLPELKRPWQGPGGQHSETDEETPLSRVQRTAEPVETLASEVDGEGRMRYYGMTLYPIAYSEELSRMVLIRRDITRRTELEQRLSHSQKLASIGELSTYIAHEIRNPVFAISGFANALLRDTTLGERPREKLTIILEESRRLDDILRSIINFSRPFSQNGTSSDVAAVVREAHYAVISGAGLGRVESSLGLAPGLPRAAIDPDLLKQCVINLIVNAREAMEGGGTLRLGARLEGNRVAVVVEDTGTGIPAELRDKIFSPFFSTRGKGAGLGLAMARKIMEDIGGELTLTSAEGKGTTVTLLLPPLLAVAQSPQSQYEEPTGT